MHHMHMSYGDIQEMPWEYLDWFYDRQIQELAELKKKQAEKNHQYI